MADSPEQARRHSQEVNNQQLSFLISSTSHSSKSIIGHAFSVCFCENLFWRDKRAAFRHTQKKGDVFLQRRRFHEAELPLARALPFFPCSVSLPALSHRHTEAHTGAHSLGPRRDLFIAAEKTWCVFFFSGSVATCPRLVSPVPPILSERVSPGSCCC